MSQLIIDELWDGVVFTQNIVVKKSVSLAWIRPWIYKEGTLQSGQLRLEVYDGATLLKQIDIDHTVINTNIPASYAHGYLRFDVEPLSLNVADTETEHVYTLKFSMVNYTDHPSHYLAICREWDQRKYQIFGSLPDGDVEEPAGYELYAYRD